MFCAEECAWGDHCAALIRASGTYRVRGGEAFMGGEGYCQPIRHCKGRISSDGFVGALAPHHYILDRDDCSGGGSSGGKFGGKAL